MIDVVLHQPEIPPNTGNVIRLCANTGARLHLIEPLGFALDDARLRRAGLDYHEFADVRTHASLEACLASLRHPRVFAFSARSAVRFDRVVYRRDDALLFGAETRGLPDDTAGKPLAAADAPGPAQPEPVERGRGRGVRGVAPDRLCGRGMTPRGHD